MEVLVPLTLTTATASSNAPADPHLVWTSTGTFSKGSRAVLDTSVYESLVDGNVGKNPTTEVDSWIRVGPTNGWAMFDASPVTSTVANNSITITLDTTGFTDVALVGVVAGYVQVVKSGVTVAQASVPAPQFPSKTSRVLLTNLQVSAGICTITITGPGQISVGHLLVGHIHEIGLTSPGAEVGISDFSLKDTNKYGTVRVTPRNYSRTFRVSVYVKHSEVDRVTALMRGTRAKVCYWLASPLFECLQVVGFYREWAVDLKDADGSSFSLSVEGLSTDDTVVAPGESSQLEGTLVYEAYSVHIESTNGDEFRVGLGTSTLLIAHVFRGDSEVTDEIPAAWFRWRRVSRIPLPPPNDDATWNAAYASGYKQVNVNVDDVSAQATFFCDILRP